MKRGRSTGTMTKEERAWVDMIKRNGCILCHERGFEQQDNDNGPMAEAHHLLSGSRRIGHMHTVGLCAHHHRGQPIVHCWDHREHRRRLGPALTDGSVPFKFCFGDDEELMRKQKALLQDRGLICSE